MDQVRQVFCEGTLPGAKWLAQLLTGQTLAQVIELSGCLRQELHDFCDIGLRKIGGD